MNQPFKRFDFAIFSKNDDKLVQFNRLVLFFVMIILIIAVVTLWTLDLAKKSDMESLSLFYTNSSFSSLEEEKRMVKSFVIDDKNKIAGIEDKAQFIINNLIYGPIKYENKSLIPIETKIKNLWFFNDTLHINFSKEFITEVNNNIVNKKLILNSIVKSIFFNILEVKNIRFYVEDNDFVTFSGEHDLQFTFRREKFIKATN